HKPKCPRVDDRKGVFHIHDPFLLLAHRRPEIDGHCYIKGIKRFDLDPGIIVSGFDRLQHLQVNSGLGELVDPGPPHLVIELPGGAIHYGHFRPVDIDQKVRDAGKVAGCHKMLDSRHAVAIGSYLRGKPRVRNHVETGRDYGAVDAEGNAEFTTGKEFKVHLFSGMEPDPVQLENSVYGRLTLQHKGVISHIPVGVKVSSPSSRPW